MARENKPSEEEESSIPAWIVSFSDMVTLLLAFFVLLQSFSHVRDPELFFAGQGSYRRAIAGLGLPEWLFGRPTNLGRDHKTPKHAVEEGQPGPDVRIIDAQGAKIREMFADLRQQMEISASDVTEKLMKVEAAPIRFAREGAALDADARKYLRQLAFDLRQTVSARSVRLYVIGLAADVPQASRQAVVSALRARAVEAALAEMLAEQGAPAAWHVSSWGGGAGGSWCRKYGFLPERSFILIAVMKEGHENG